MKPTRFFYRAFDGIVHAACLYGAVPFSLGGFALGVWAGERLWQYLGISMSVVTVYADMAFGLAGLLVGSYLAFLLIAWLESATFDGRIARYRIEHGDEIRETIERANRAEPNWCYRDRRQEEADDPGEDGPPHSMPYRTRFSFESNHTTIALPGIASGLAAPASSRRTFRSRAPRRTRGSRDAS